MSPYREVISPPNLLAIRTISPENPASIHYPIVCPRILKFGDDRFKLVGAINYNASTAHFSSCIIFNGYLYSAEEGIPNTAQKCLTWKAGYSDGGGWDGQLGKEGAASTAWIFYRLVETIII
jgi:hypothetical protein